MGFELSLTLSLPGRQRAALTHTLSLDGELHVLPSFKPLSELVSLEKDQNWFPPFSTRLLGTSLSLHPQKTLCEAVYLQNLICFSPKCDSIVPFYS